MWNRQASYTGIFFLLFLFLFGCHSRRQVQAGKPNRHLSTNKIIDSVMNQKLLFDYFASKLSVDIESSSLNESFSANLKIRKDSLIWIYIKKAAIPVAQAVITKDSVKILVKIGKGEGYYPRAFSYLNDLFDTELDYNMLQDLLTANPMSFDSDEKYKSPADSSYYYLTTHRKRKLRKALEHDRVYKKHPVIYQYKLYPKTFKPYQVWINDINDTTTFDATYTQYEGLDSIPLPGVLVIEASKGPKKVKLKLEYKRTKLNEKTDFPFNIPDGYKKL